MHMNRILHIIVISCLKRDYSNFFVQGNWRNLAISCYSSGIPLKFPNLSSIGITKVLVDVFSHYRNFGIFLIRFTVLEFIH